MINWVANWISAVYIFFTPSKSGGKNPLLLTSLNKKLQGIFQCITVFEPIHHSFRPMHHSFQPMHHSFQVLVISCSPKDHLPGSDHWPTQSVRPIAQLGDPAALKKNLPCPAALLYYPLQQFKYICCLSNNKIIWTIVSETVMVGIHWHSEGISWT